jgi:5-methylthioadenosine/S-adenosylhomocysteine deaminase
MATSLGAQAIGMQDKIGSLETGKQADMIVVNTATPRMTPLITDGKLFNLHHNLVHAVQGQDIVMTMVAGKILVQNGQLVNADLQKLIDDVNVVAPKLFKRRDLWLAQRGTSVNELQRVE